MLGLSARVPQFTEPGDHTFGPLNKRDRDVAPTHENCVQNTQHHVDCCRNHRDNFAIGNILFGHFNERTPKWKRVTKVVLVLVFIGIISAEAGPAWGLARVVLMLILAAVVHLWWLPRHGINGFTGEPRDKYYELRGWTRKP